MTNNTSDPESTHHDDQCPPSELDSLIRHSEYKPTKKQARLALLQFLTFCSALFMVGWTDGSTGPLLPTIKDFYGVSTPIPAFSIPSEFLCRLALEQCLGYLFRIARSVMLIFVVILRLAYTTFQGMVVGAVLNMPLVDRIGLGNVSFTNLILVFLSHDSKFDLFSSRWSCSGLSCRLLRSTLNLVNFPSHFSLYPSFSAELEWYSRLVLLFYFIYTGRNFNKSFQDACANGFIATLSKDSEFKMSMIHAAYGTTSFLVLQLWRTHVIRS